MLNSCYGIKGEENRCLWNYNGKKEKGPFIKRGEKGSNIISWSAFSHALGKEIGVKQTEYRRKQSLTAHFRSCIKNKVVIVLY